MPASLQTAAMLISDRAPPRGAVNIKLLLDCLGRALSSFIMLFVRGTRCVFLAFIRAAGIVQRAVSKSISSHVAYRTSPDRAAVPIKNSRARAPVPSLFSRSTIEAGTSCQGSAL